MRGLRCIILSSLRCRLTTTRSSRDWSKTCCSLLHTCGSRSGSEFKVLNSVISKCNGKTITDTRVLRSMSTRNWRKTANTAGSVGKGLGREFRDGMAKEIIQNESVSKSFTSIQVFDSQQKIMANENLKQNVKIFAMDIETTGFCGKTGRIIQIAFRDLSGGENSCFHTLVNPQQHVPNSKFHGITNDMVKQQDVPRMEELIPIIIQYVESRQTTGGPALFLAHNGRRFDFRFLLREFIRCSMQIPNDWLFLDTLRLAHELISKGLKLSPGASLSHLCEHYNIQQKGLQRAMTDVNLLTEIFWRLTFDLELTESHLLERSLKASELLNLLKKPLK